jgi:Ca-activated chloride channel homolog
VDFLLQGVFMNKYVLEYKGSNAQSSLGKQLKHVGLVLTLCLFWLMSEHVLASQVEEQSASETKSHSSIWLKDESGQRYEIDAASLKTKVDISVSGPIIRATVTQEFHNPTQLWMEGVYTYPLPENAAVDQMRMRVGERIIEGQIKEKEQAKKQYEKAKQEGKRASLVSNARTNQFKTRVANIAPNAKVEVVFEYQQMLQYDAQTYSFRFPMTFTPQYTPPRAVNDPHFLPPENAIKHPQDANDNPVEISVQVNAGFPIHTMHSASHSVDFDKQSEERFSAHLRGDAQSSNRDFQLAWTLKGEANPMVSMLRETRSDGEYGFLMIMPPALDLAAQSELSGQSRELILVLDVSGSMQGESIRQARAALSKAIETIDSDARFNLILFNTGASKMFRQSERATNENKRFALEFVRNINADGGTEMAPAIKLALAHDASQRSNREGASSEDAVLRQVVFITDGAVGNEQELFDLIRSKLGNSRLFTVGIGSAPNSYFMRKAARAGRGSFTFISSPHEVVSKMDGLFQKLSAPAMTDIRFELDDAFAEVLPDTLPDLYLNQPVYVSFRVGSFPGAARLNARLLGRPSYMNVPMTEAKQSPGVAVEWARLKLDSLLERHREVSGDAQKRVENQLVDLALAHHQVTKFTSMLAVDVTPIRAGGQLELKRFKSNLPKGWRNSNGTFDMNPDSGLRLAQTSTLAPFNIFLGLMMLVLALVIGLTGRLAHVSAK